MKRDACCVLRIIPSDFRLDKFKEGEINVTNL